MAKKLNKKQLRNLAILLAIGAVAYWAWSTRQASREHGGRPVKEHAGKEHGGTAPTGPAGQEHGGKEHAGTVAR